MNPPRFSIVTPSLNQRAFVEDMIRSIIEQEGNFEIEYFIMDGGSTDGPLDVIQKYVELVNSGRYPVRCLRAELHWRSESDSGQSDAINRGLRCATGCYAAYINSDDMYIPGVFAAAARAFERHPEADIIYGDGEVVNELGQRQWEWLARPYDHRVMTTYHFLWNDFTNYIMQQSTFWRTSVHHRLGLFDETFHYAMDVEYWACGRRRPDTPAYSRKTCEVSYDPGHKVVVGSDGFLERLLGDLSAVPGAKHLCRYLAYYYFNLAMQNGWDLEAARSEAAWSLHVGIASAKMSGA